MNSENFPPLFYVISLSLVIAGAIVIIVALMRDIDIRLEVRPKLQR